MLKLEGRPTIRVPSGASTAIAWPTDAVPPSWPRVVFAPTRPAGTVDRAGSAKVLGAGATVSLSGIHPAPTSAVAARRCRRLGRPEGCR